MKLLQVNLRILLITLGHAQMFPVTYLWLIMKITDSDKPTRLRTRAVTWTRIHARTATKERMESDREGYAQAVANRTEAQGLSSVVMATGCLMSGAVKSQQSWYRGKTVMEQRRHSQLVTEVPVKHTAGRLRLC
jgi:hypothetical protein